MEVVELIELFLFSIHWPSIRSVVWRPWQGWGSQGEIWTFTVAFHNATICLWKEKISIVCMHQEESESKKECHLVFFLWWRKKVRFYNESCEVARPSKETYFHARKHAKYTWNLMCFSVTEGWNTFRGEYFPESLI